MHLQFDAWTVLINILCCPRTPCLDGGSVGAIEASHHGAVHRGVVVEAWVGDGESLLQQGQ